MGVVAGASRAICSAIGRLSRSRASKKSPRPTATNTSPTTRSKHKSASRIKAFPTAIPTTSRRWGAVGVLSGGMSARLFTEVREHRGLCYSVYAAQHTLYDRGAVFCYAGTGADRAQETLEVTLGELVRLAEGVKDAELDRVKARIKSGLIMQQESSSARSSSLVRDWYHLGYARTLDEVGRLIDQLSRAEHQRLFGRASAV